MIIWINGTYGVGKTSVAKALTEMLPTNKVELLELDVFCDTILKKVLKNPRKSEYFYSDIEGMSQFDIQFYEEFRGMIEENAHEIIVVDTAITEKACKNIAFDYLSGKCHDLLHIILVADEEIIKSRIESDSKRKDKLFALSYLKENISFLNENFKDAIRITTDNRNEYEIAKDIIEMIKF